MTFVRTVFVALAAVVASSACDDASKKQPTAAIVASAVAVPAPSPPTGPTEPVTFTSEKSKLGFVGSKITGSHEGTFEKFSGSMRLNGGKAEGGGVEVQIDMGSLKVEPDKLATHLKSGDFLDTARFPMASFKSTEVKAGGAKGATHTVNGNLNLHGKEKSISFPATITLTDSEVAAKSEFTINRKDFDIVYPGMPNDLIRDAVVIKLDLHAPRSVVAQAKDTVHTN
jgi:polyisoprenoid-binding protein YceI